MLLAKLIISLLLNRFVNCYMEMNGVKKDISYVLSLIYAQVETMRVSEANVMNEK